VGFSVRDLLRQAAERPDLLEDPEFREVYDQLAGTVEKNPLLAFEPHPANDGRRPQLEFIEASTRIVAAFAGNRFGKSTVLMACALRECLDRADLPPLLAATKRFDPPTDGWILVPTEDKIFDSFWPVIRKWCPPAALHGGNLDKAWNGARMILRFKNGSTISFKTYKQHESTLGGAALHFVGYDEPPPKTHREEGRIRLADYGGYEMFAMTPLATNTGYIRRAIWKQREAPNITVVKGSIHDNPTLNKEAVRDALGDLSDVWRQAREFGDFVHVGGQIYPDFERCVVKEPFDLDFIRSLDVVVGIDPGIRNAGFAWVGFDKDLSAYVFNEGLLQDKEAHEYAAFIKSENSRLGLRNVAYVCDPAMRSRGQVTAETVMSALAKEGIYANSGQNSHEAGFDQLRTRMRLDRFHVDPRCVGMRDEADEYVSKPVEEGKDDSHFDPVGGNNHRMDALRYAVMERFWDPWMEDQAPLRTLGFDPSRALASEYMTPQSTEAGHPLGSMF
jgi:phage terminase large subunit-like protein